MAATTKLVNGVSVPLTADDIAEMAAMEEAADLDLQLVRGNRNSHLARTDWTQLGDAALGDHTPEEWATYRQSLRDLPSVYSRVSEVVWPNDPPTQVIVDAEEAARLASENDEPSEPE